MIVYDNRSLQHVDYSFYFIILDRDFPLNLSGNGIYWIIFQNKSTILFL